MPKHIHATILHKSFEQLAESTSVAKQWQLAHTNAWSFPRNGFEQSIGDMIRGAIAYADTHRERYESGIGEDYVLGQHWASVMMSVRALLNGDCGGFDCGTLDSLILAMLEAEGFDEDGKRRD